MFIILAITHDGIDKIYGCTNNENVAKSKVAELESNPESEHHDYIYETVNELESIS